MLFSVAWTSAAVPLTVTVSVPLFVTLAPPEDVKVISP